MQVELSEKEIDTILGCSLFVMLHIDEYDNFFKAKQLKNNSEILYAKMEYVIQQNATEKLYAQLKKAAEKDQKNEN